MAFQISGTTIINNQGELATGLVSAYDRVFSTATSVNAQNRDHITLTANSIGVNLPGSPVAGNEVVVIVAGNFPNSYVWPGPSQRIMGQALNESMFLDIAYAAMNFVYIDATQGWRVF